MPNRQVDRAHSITQLVWMSVGGQCLHEPEHFVNIELVLLRLTLSD